MRGALIYYADGLTKLFKEIKEKETIDELSIEYKKFAEWLRIESVPRTPFSASCLRFGRVAATIYHLFLAEDNSPDLFAQAKRIHSMIPYTALKQVIRFANPVAVMAGVLDLFLAQPFGTRSLVQRAFGLAINDGIKSFQRAIDSLVAKVADPVLCEKLKSFCDAEEEIKNAIRSEAAAKDEDLVVVILGSELINPELTSQQVGKVFNAFAAWNNAVDNVSLAA